MNETYITGEVLKHLRGQLAGSEVLKHKDTGTRGVPDISVGWRDRASYVELKHLKKGRSLKEICDGAQLSLCHRLACVHGGRSWVIVFEDSPKQVTVWKPRALFKHLWPRLAGQGEDEWSTTVDPLWAPLNDFLKGDVIKVLDVHGAITTDWSYLIPTVMVVKAMERVNG